MNLGLRAALLLGASVVLATGGFAPPPGAGSAVLDAGAASAVRRSERPDIVMVMADDMRADELRFMPRTRRIIGRHGLTFENAFSENPLCCPARASFLSGQYSHNHHVFSSLNPYGFQSFDDRYTMVTALQRSGYRTALVGKYLNGYGYQKSLVSGGPSLRYVPPGYTDWYASVEPPAGSGYTGGTYHYDHVVYNHNGVIDDHHHGEYSTVGISRISQALIRKYAAGDQPFFLWSSFVAPHTGLPIEPDDPHHATPARPAWVKGRFDGVIDRAPGLPRDGGKVEADMRDKPYFMSRVPEPRAGARRGMLNNTRQRAEAVYVLDREVAKIVRTLKRSGRWERTVLMFASDNGFFLGEHRRKFGKILGYEPSLRVPFLVTGPGMRSRERRYDPIDMVDMAATVLDLAGATHRLAARHPLDGTSRLPAMLEGDQGWQAPIVTEGHIWRKVDRRKAHQLGFTGTGRSYIGIRTAQYSLIRTVRGTLELYDLAVDANEMSSRHRAPAYRKTKRLLLQVWDDYKDCAGAACRVPLPEALQAGPRAERRLTTSFWHQVDQEHAY